jgi:hypothetical protein
MDQLTRYRALVRRLLGDKAELMQSQPAPGLETFCVFDTEHDHYLLLTLGWSERRRVRGTILFVRIRDGKLWVEEDMTEEGIATELVNAGVPRQHIVLAFQHPEMRPYTEFAVA